MEKREIKREQILIDGSTSPWIEVKGVGRIGMWAWDKKAIILDYSMKWIVGSNEEIPCSKSEIADKVLRLFNNPAAPHPKD